MTDAALLEAALAEALRGSARALHACQHARGFNLPNHAIGPSPDDGGQAMQHMSTTDWGNLKFIRSEHRRTRHAFPLAGNELTALELVHLSTFAAAHHLQMTDL